LLPGVRLVDVARRLLAQQPDPPRRVSVGDLIEIYGPNIVFTLVVVPILVVLYVTIRARQPVPLDVTIKAAGFTALAMALVLTWILFNLRKTLRDGVAATGEVLDATRSAGHVRVEINGRAVDKAYRSATFERFVPRDRITVLVDRHRESVFIALGRVGPGF
jgi:hypothetical protein